MRAILSGDIFFIFMQKKLGFGELYCRNNFGFKGLKITLTTFNIMTLSDCVAQRVEHLLTVRYRLPQDKLCAVD